MRDYTDFKPPTLEELKLALDAAHELRASEYAARRKLCAEGRCVQCGAFFLHGIEHARMIAEEVAFMGGQDLQVGDPYCGFCWLWFNAEPNDPDSIPEHGHA